MAICWMRGLILGDTRRKNSRLCRLEASQRNFGDGMWRCGSAGGWDGSFLPLISLCTEMEHQVWSGLGVTFLLGPCKSMYHGHKLHDKRPPKLATNITALLCPGQQLIPPVCHVRVFPGELRSLLQRLLAGLGCTE